MRRFFWDYFGPHAEGTAVHMRKHIDEFLAREKLDGCTTGIVPGEGHVAIFCDTPDDHQEVIQRVLKPKRYVDS